MKLLPLLACLGLLGSALAADAPAYPFGAVPVASGVTIPGLPKLNGLIRVDQFGYRPDAVKVAVLASPRSGYNAFLTSTPSEQLELCRAEDGRTVFTAPVRRWQQGAVDRSSGDAGWWFDFSAVTAPGRYYVYDRLRDERSPVFRIAPDVYRQVLRAAVRVFYHQRENFAHEPRYAEGPWTDAASFTQDVHTRALWAKNDPAQERDLSGGWMDAGDQNKYITFLAEVIHPLLYAYTANPAAFGDDFGIPESGNGLPDLLDEVKYELDWMQKMQDADGGVFIKMGEIDYGSGFPPSAIRKQRYYAPKSSAAAIAYAGILAHAARVYAAFPVWKDYAAGLQQHAEAAYRWYVTNPHTAHVDTGEVKSGIADRSLDEQDAAQAVAAFNLYVLTKDRAYLAAFARTLPKFRQMKEHFWTPYDAGQGEVLFEYLKLPEADRPTAALIERKLRASLPDPILTPGEKDSLYRAYMPLTCFHWGSNLIWASAGTNALNVARSELGAGSAPVYLTRAADLLHYLHGVNALGMVYLTNMSSLGAAQSPVHLYHTWFGAGTPFTANPPPGYLVGGPNQSYTGKRPDGALAWIAQQPPAKAYADLNQGHPENSWEITEPGIYYQAMYIRLLSEFVRP